MPYKNAFSSNVRKNINGIFFLIITAFFGCQEEEKNPVSASGYYTQPASLTVILNQGDTVNTGTLELIDDDGNDCADVETYEIDDVPTGLTIFRPADNITSGCDPLILTLVADVNAPTTTYTRNIIINKGSRSELAVRITIVVQPKTGIDVTISADMSVRAGDSSNTLVNIGRYNVSDAISLSVEGLPSGVSPTFNPNPVPNAQSTLTLVADVTTTSGNYPVKIIGSTNSGYVDTLETILEVLPALSTNWTLVSRAPQLFWQMEDVDFTYNSFGVIVGDGGYPFYSHNGGLTWTQASVSGAQQIIYYGVDGRDSTFWAVGGEGGENIIYSTNAGVNWSSTGFVEYTTYYDVSVTDSSVYVVGSAQVTSNNFARKLKGGAWEISNAGTSSSLFGVHFINDSTGIAVGEAGTIIKTTNYGETWETKSSGVSSDLQDVYFLNETQGYAVGNNGVILYTNSAGEMWAQQTSNTTVRLNKIHAANNNVITIVGQYNAAPPTTYSILRTEDGGYVWIEELSGFGISNENQLTGVYMFDAMNAIAVGWGGSIWRRQ